MLTDYFRCYNINNKSTAFHKEKKTPKRKGFHFLKYIFQVFKALLQMYIGVLTDKSKSPDLHSVKS